MKKDKDYIQYLPAPTEQRRVETGAVQFGDDWPGMFIRGDDAMMLLQSIHAVLDKYGEEDPDFSSIPAKDLHLHIQIQYLKGFARMIDEDVHGRRPPSEGEDSVNDQ